MNHTEHLKVFIDRDRIFGDTLAVRMGRPVSGKWAVMEPAQFRVLTDDEASQETLPAFTLSKSDAQAFMDELWHAGFRPSEGSGSAGAMAAVQAHLQDMRKLVFTESETVTHVPRQP